MSYSVMIEEALGKRKCLICKKKNIERGELCLTVRESNSSIIIFSICEFCVSCFPSRFHKIEELREEE